MIIIITFIIINIKILMIIVIMKPLPSRTARSYFANRHETVQVRRCAQSPSNIVDFRGFDSSIILIIRGGIPTYIGDFPESLSQAMLVGTILVERLGVRIQTGVTSPPPCFKENTIRSLAWLSRPFQQLFVSRFAVFPSCRSGITIVL